MDRRTLLKLLGGVAALPALGKLIKGKTAVKTAKVAGKILPKVEGMPDWFPSLVAKIEKEGRLATEGTGLGDNLKIKELVIPSKTGKGGDEIFKKIEYPDGKIEIQANIEGGAYGQPFEISYTPPKTDIDVTTGKVIKEPGDFSIIEQRPKPDPNDPGNYEFDYEMVSKDEALSDLEKVEKITTGKIKNLTEAEARAAQRKNYFDSPYDDISNRYPEPDIDYDYANGGLASFANGGKAKKKKLTEDPSEEELKQIYEEGVIELAGEKAPPGLLFDTEKGQGVMNLFFGPKIKQDRYPGVNIKDPRIGLYYSPNYENETAPRFDFSIGPKGGSLGFTKRFADGGLTKTVPPARGPDSQGVETLFRKRYS